MFSGWLKPEWRELWETRLLREQRSGHGAGELGPGGAEGALGGAGCCVGYRGPRRVGESWYHLGGGGGPLAHPSLGFPGEQK